MDQNLEVILTNELRRTNLPECVRPRAQRGGSYEHVITTGHRRHSCVAVIEDGHTPDRRESRPTFVIRRFLQGGIIRHSAFVIALLLSTILHQLSTPTALAQYSIPWHTIDGGGGTSTGGVYSVSGTIGQHDAGGPMTNGQYSVTGGFWALPTAIQVTGAPTLTIAHASPGNATISWSPNTSGYILQQTALLSPSNWTNSPSGATNPITISATNTSKFYRLFKP